MLKRTLVSAALIALGSVSSVISGQTGKPAPSGSKTVEMQKLRDNLYLLTGGGGNSLFLVTDLGVVLVDTKESGWEWAISSIS